MSLQNEFVTSMSEFNSRLVSSLVRLDFEEYFKEAHVKCFPSIDMSFMDYFLTLAGNPETFVVNQEKLVEYGVITNIDSTSSIKRCLQKFEFLKENVDYLLDHITQQDRKHGGSNKKVYLLTQDAFKLCLMRSKNSLKYAQYYLLLEKVTSMHYKYNSAYKNKLLATKDDKIDTLKNKVDEQTKKINDLLSRTDHIIGQNDDLKDQNKDLKEEVLTIKDQNEDLKSNVDELLETNDKLEVKVDAIRDVLYDALEDRNQKAEDPNEQHQFALLKKNGSSNEYKVIRRQSHTMKYKIAEMRHEWTAVINCEDDPNPITMYRRFKELVDSEILEKMKKISKMKLPREVKTSLRKSVKENHSIKYNRNDIEIDLSQISEKAFLAKMRQCMNDKFNVEVP